MLRGGFIQNLFQMHNRLILLQTYINLCRRKPRFYSYLSRVSPLYMCELPNADCCCFPAKTRLDLVILLP